MGLAQVAAQLRVQKTLAVVGGEQDRHRPLPDATRGAQGLPRERCCLAVPPFGIDRLDVPRYMTFIAGLYQSNPRNPTAPDSGGAARKRARSGDGRANSFIPSQHTFQRRGNRQ